MRQRRLPVVLAAIGIGCAAGPDIELRGEGAEARFAVVGLDGATLAVLARDEAQRRALFTVSVVDKGGAPVLGRHAVAGDALTFAPRFPLQRALTYHCVFVTPAGQRVERSFTLRQSAAPAPTVRVYPSADLLPENTLRFYLQFSQPMQQGDVYRHVRLVRDDDVVVQGAFLEIGEELWDASGTRLTLLCDPGRVKRGLRPRQEDGPILEEGRTFALVVDARWHSAAGVPLPAEVRKSFGVGAPDVQQPQPQRWRLTPPAAGTRAPLTVQFEQPLDQALLQRMLRVADANGIVEGDIDVQAETTWSFVPRRPWSAGTHRLLVDSDLEDPSGNSVRAPFEVDAWVPRQEVPNTIDVPFTITASLR